MTTTEERMETLEKQVRRQRRWNIALGVVVVVGGLMAARNIQEVPDVIRAKSFEVVNDEGKVRIMMAHDSSSNESGVILVDNSGPRVALACDPRQSALQIYDKANVMRLDLGYVTGGSVGMLVRDKNNRKRISLGSDLQSQFKLVVNGPNEKSAVIVGNESSGDCGISLNDKRGINRINTMITDSGAYHQHFDANGKWRITIGTTKSNTALLGLAKSSEEEHWSISSR